MATKIIFLKMATRIWRHYTPGPGIVVPALHSTLHNIRHVVVPHIRLGSVLVHRYNNTTQTGPKEENEGGDGGMNGEGVCSSQGLSISGSLTTVSPVITWNQEALAHDVLIFPVQDVSYPSNSDSLSFSYHFTMLLSEQASSRFAQCSVLVNLLVIVRTLVCWHCGCLWRFPLDLAMTNTRHVSRRHKARNKL